jgi:hypothetical protein
MSLKDKLEIGLKPEASYRKDNLPEFQQDDPACNEAAQPGQSREAEAARRECDDTAERSAVGRPARKKKARGRKTSRANPSA